MKYYIKVSTGFREDQQTTIPIQEAHKAYYLFKHPEERGVFDCGVALIGKNIQEILPDWNATMGWNPIHELDIEDWSQLRGSGIEKKMKELIKTAKDVADLIEENKQIMKIKLQEAMKLLPEEKQVMLLDEEVKQLADKFKI